MTIYDIARLSGYSVSTVSKALNNYSDISAKTREKILAVVKSNDFKQTHSAHRPAAAKNKLIGVLYEEKVGIGLENYLFIGILNSFKNYVEARGYSIIFINSNDDSDYYKRCLEYGVEGVLILVCDINDTAVTKLIEHIPTVSADNIFLDTYSVTSDHKQAISEAMQYLFTLGHTKIGLLAGPTYSSSSMERYHAYRKALEIRNIRYSQALVETCTNFDFISGHRAMERLLLRAEPTAVVTCGDLVALGATAKVLEGGLKVPDDISIIGFDDIEAVRYSTPPLTSIRQDRLQIGELSAELLISLMNGETPSRKRYAMSTSLQIRSSTGEVKG